MNLLIDESVDSQITERLRRDGHRVLSVADMDPGIPDDLVLSKANEANAVLVTAGKDFGELVFRLGRINNGVLLIRLAGLSNERKAEIVATTVSSYENDLPGAFTVISPGMVRIRRKS